MATMIITNIDSVANAECNYKALVEYLKNEINPRKEEMLNIITKNYCETGITAEIPLEQYLNTLDKAEKLKALERYLNVCEYSFTEEKEAKAILGISEVGTNE